MVQQVLGNCSVHIIQRICRLLVLLHFTLTTLLTFVHLWCSILAGHVQNIFQSVTKLRADMIFFNLLCSLGKTYICKISLAINFTQAFSYFMVNMIHFQTVLCRFKIYADRWPSPSLFMCNQENGAIICVLFSAKIVVYLHLFPASLVLFLFFNLCDLPSQF